MGITQKVIFLSAILINVVRLFVIFDYTVKKQTRVEMSC